MFRYEAIRKGECFRAYIRVPEEHYDDIVKILSKDYIYSAVQGEVAMESAE